MRGAELWTCHPCPATLEGVRVAEISSLSEDESRAHRLGGQRRSEELRCILTQGRPELSRASRVAAGGGRQEAGEVLMSEGPVQETPARTLTSPSKALALKPLVSSAEQMSTCTRLRYP